ncbi:MAG: cyclic nucleotide-binding domain-containing protein [Cyanothece sp. SIO2G6]|nr:cyclic nucleotide-binding domain-containing protein [Cyanothece sp. SIO2G6]
MPLPSVIQRFNVPTPRWKFTVPTIQWKLSRLTQLLLLAVTMLIYISMTMTVGISLFISRVGVGQLPIAFILIGFCSIPIYGLFSQVVDQYSRVHLFRSVLILSITVVLGMRFLLVLDTTPVYYFILIFTFFQWDFYNNVLYPTLVMDYFSTLEYKRHASFVSIAQAVGAFLGGCILALLARWVDTANLLLCVLLVYAIAIGQLLYLERSQRPIMQLSSSAQSGKSSGLWDSLQTFPSLVKRYPLALLLAGSSFLLVIIYQCSEFIWFSVYGEAFNEQDLTSFLGLIRVITSVLQVAVVYGITRPLIQNLGVARMNLMYPLTTLASLVGLLLNVNVPAAVTLHMNGDGLYKAINIPVHQLNYNAIPREFVGRIRSLSDGVIYAMGLTLAGVILLIGHHLLSLSQLAWMVVGMTILMLVVRWPMGRLYGEGLEAMIRSNTIDLDDFTESGVPLPDRAIPVVQEWLSSPNLLLQTQGLELATSFGTASEFLPNVQELVLQGNNAVWQAALGLVAHNHDSTFKQQCQQWFDADNTLLRQFALEALVVSQHEFSEVEIEALLHDPDPNIQLLGCLAALQQDLAEVPAVQAVGEQVRQYRLNEQTIQTLLRVVFQSPDRDFIPLLQPIVIHPDARLVQQALRSLSTLATVNDTEVADIAVTQCQHEDQAVRLEVFKILGKTRCSHLMDTVAMGLGDEDFQVRQQAAKSLANYGAKGLELAQEQLKSSDPERVKSAIATIGQFRTRQASNILFDYLASDRQQLTQTRKWQQQIPSNDSRWLPMAIAIADYHQRVIQRVLYVLSSLGYGRTVNTISRILTTPNHTDTDNAIEVLASSPHRRFIAPILPLLDQTTSTSGLQRNMSASVRNQWFQTKGYRILLQALESSDRWIRVGALIALSQIASVLSHDADPFVKAVAREIFPKATQPQLFSPTQTVSLSSAMNRILLLKNVSIFNNLSLDELLLLDQAIEQQQVLAGQTIYDQGNWGTHLYIVAAGQVRLTKTIGGQSKTLRTLSKEQFFGEVALFDEAPRWDSAIAIEDCILLKLEKSRFISLGTQRPHIILEVCRFLSQRLREIDDYRFDHNEPLFPNSDEGKTRSPNYHSDEQEHGQDGNATPTAAIEVMEKV